MSLEPEISIVTPSYNMLPYLRLCCASVSDQQGVRAEQLVMDGASTDGTKEWLSSNENTAEWVSRKDKGMYDALNAGFQQSKGEIVAHLNTDEQYLPGTLSFVTSFFRDNPDIDFITGDFLVVGPDGDFKCYRKSFKAFWPFIFSDYLYTFTCTLFFRRKILDVCTYDENYASVSDSIFYHKMLKLGFRGRHIKRYMSVFTDTNSNLSLNDVSKVEKHQYFNTLPLWFRLSKPFFRILFQFARLVNGNFNEKKTLDYTIYRHFDRSKRLTTRVSDPTWKWNFSKII